MSGCLVNTRLSALPRLLLRDPPVDRLPQNRQRQRAGHQHLGVEIAHVEFVAKLRLRLLAQPLDGQRADFIGQRLAGDGDVALDLRGGVDLAPGRYCRDVFDCLLAGPALGKDAGLDVCLGRCLRCAGVCRLGDQRLERHVQCVDESARFVVESNRAFNC